MSDICDMADKTIEFQQGVNLYKSHRDVPDSCSTGECWFCGEYLPAGHRWCNTECRDDWEKENR